ncbi:MAG: hypothetical protein JWN72_2603, partial [Thermoleophilia bacterium]|nr:hypothetical protein [Thermoleophilia bacterium]
MLTSTTLSLSGCSDTDLDMGALTVGGTALTGACRIGFGANAPAQLTLSQRDRDGAAMTQASNAWSLRSGAPTYSAVDAVDANDIWVGGVATGSGSVPLLLTTDAGSTWITVTACWGMANIVRIVAYK